MQVTTRDTNSAVEVSASLFESEFNESLVHQAVVAYMAGGRAGTKAQKTRSDVRGGGAKPWRQKGTGRARAGTIRSPIWRSGGVTFAARPRDFSKKLNKKMYRAAMRSILAELLRQERLLIVDDFALEAAKTKAVLAKLGELGVKDALIVKPELDETIWLASRNLPYVTTTDVQGLNPVELIRYENVVMTKSALQAIEEWLS